MPKTLPISELLAMAGQALPPSDWFEITQERIDAFADATEDHQFIHVDPERAAASPFGGTIAHGFLTLSLLPHLIDEVSVVPENLAMAVNYGLNRLRFLQPVPSASRVRAHARVLDVQEKSAGRFLVTSEITVEIEGAQKPALIAEMLLLYITIQPGG